MRSQPRSDLLYEALEAGRQIEAYSNACSVQETQTQSGSARPGLLGRDREHQDRGNLKILE